MAIRVGIDRNRADAHFGAGAHDTDGNFSTVGDQDFCYHWHFLDR
jgi:hypothetical protein